MRLWEQVDEWYYLRTAQNRECVCLFLVKRLTPVVRLCTSFFRQRSHARGFSPCEASLGATVSKACGRREFSKGRNSRTLTYSAPACKEHRTDNKSTRKEVSKLSLPNHEFKYWTRAQGAFPPLPDQVSGTLPIADGATVCTDADSNGVVTERRRTQVPTPAWPTLIRLDVSARTVPAKSQELSTQPNMGSRTVLASYRFTSTCRTHAIAQPQRPHGAHRAQKSHR